MKLRTQKTCSIAGWGLSLVGYVIVVRKMMLPHVALAPDTMMYLQKAATGLLLCTMVFVVLVYYTVVIKSAFGEIIKNILLVVVTLLLILLVFECYFLNKEESNAIGERWSYKLWDKKYLAAHRTNFYYVNSIGKRERADFREPLPDSTDKRKRILFIGDSFTFGFGIENTSQTFPFVVEERLNGKYLCVNLGDGGADTYKEEATLLAYNSMLTTDPSAVVWQYLGNDIDANDEGPDLYEKELSKSARIQFGKIFFKGKSFLLDYIFWHFFMGNEQGAFVIYTDFLKRLFNEASGSDDCTTPYCQHLQPLKKAASYYREKNTPFIVVVYPFLWDNDFELSRELYTNRVNNDLRQYGIDVIDLTPMIEKIPANQRVVNSHDPHPSVLVARLTADTIAKTLKKRYNIQ